MMYRFVAVEHWNLRVIFYAATVRQWTNDMETFTFESVCPLQAPVERAT